MLGLTECTLTYTWWIVKWAVQSVGKDTRAAQVWVVFQFAVLRLGVSLDQWLFTTLFLEMEKRWHCYFTAVISAQLRAGPGDTSSSSLCLIQHGVLMVRACSVSRLLFLLPLWEGCLHLGMSKIFCLHDDSFWRAFLCLLFSSLKNSCTGPSGKALVRTLSSSPALS